MTELDKILEPIKDLNYKMLEDISKELISRGHLRMAVGIMLHKAIMYLLKKKDE